MRLKKGFTLAEILIVLMVIGVIATLTIPSMMRGVQEAQLKAGYKKAFNTIANFASMERVAGSLPAQANDINTANLYAALNQSLSVKTIITDFPINNGAVYTEGGKVGKTVDCVKANGVGVGVLTNTGTCGSGDVTVSSASNILLTSASTTKTTWFETEDNLSYAITTGGGKPCATMQQLAGETSDSTATGKACAVVIVDVNGVRKLPNIFEPQGLGASKLNTSGALSTLTGDQYKIYLGSDGASAGPRSATVTGRIINGIK